MLDKDFVDFFKEKTPPWGPMGYVIYKRTYARRLPDDTSEEWWQTCERVCNGLHELNPKIWNQQSLRMLFVTMFYLKGSVSGRALWQLGTETVRKVGSDSLQNCFNRDVRIHTSDGIRPIGECVGTQILQTEYGKWVEAEVKSFGEQKTRTIRLSRFGKQTKELRCTDEHRWFTYSKSDGKQEKLTKDLEPGDKLVFISGQVNGQASLDGIRAGLVFGGGTKTIHGSRAYLSAKDVGELEVFFQGYKYTEKSDGAREFYYLPSWAKDRPSLDLEKGYLKGWLMGYFAADGYAKPNGKAAHLDNFSKQNLEFAKSVASVVGIPTGPIYSQTKVSNLTGKECVCYSLPLIISDPDFFLLQKHKSEMVERKREGKQLAWKVEEVCDDYREEEVFCAVVPGTHSFVLEDNILTGNCWHVVVNKLEAFTFTFNQLMLGGGVGFNVLPENVYELPAVKHCPTVERVESHDCDFIVPDNREGWVELLKRILDAFTTTGKPVLFDTSCIRAKGKPIKGFGGTASGPEDLVKGVSNIVSILKRRYGHKLRPVDCMDIMNIIGQIVVAGNVRRSSEIALGHFHDFDYLDAKNWAKHQIPNWRTMSNNSVVAETVDQLPDCFWESGFTPVDGSDEVGGEPYGLVNLKNCREFGRLVDGRSADRDPLVMGVNPCVTSDTWVQTHVGPRMVRDLIGEEFKVIVNGKDHPISSDGFVFTGHKEVVEVKTSSGFSVKCTPCHRLLTAKGWKKAGSLTSEDSLVLDHSESEWYGDLDSNIGWLVGQWLGDGTTADNRAILKWWGEEVVHRPMAATLIKETVGGRADIGSGSGPTVSSVNLFSAIGDLNLEDKCIGETVETQGSDFYKGFLRGWFDADGHVIHNPLKGSCVRLTSTKLENLKAAQRMLARLGIISTVYENRRDEGYRDLPGGTYWCQATHELHISKDMIELFADKIGFSVTGEHQLLMEVLSNRSRAPYKTRFESKVVLVESCRSQDVYDVTVPGVECFNANGIIAHNCAEITLGDKEPCNLAEVFLPNITSIDEFKDVAAILFKACKTISNAGFSDPDTHAIVQKHHRIGVGLTGCMQAEHWLQGVHLDSVYKHLETFDRKLSDEMGINVSIKRTTIKPSGTLSLLPGVTPGMHGALGRYMLRTVRFSANHPLVKVCREHGYRVEPKLEMDGSHDHGTMVIYFPIKQVGRLAEELNVIEELEIQKHLQTFWSDNAVSATHYFEPGDVPRLKAWLQENYENGVKSTSFLRREGHGFKQAPFQPISEEQYLEEVAKVRPITHAKIVYDGDDLDSDLECAGGNCPVR